MHLVLLAIALLLGGAVLAMLVYSRPVASTGLGALFAVAGCAVGLVPATRALAGHTMETVSLPWHVPGGDLLVGLDPLSAFFLVPLLVLGALAAIYGRSYLQAYRDRWLGPPAAAFNLMLAAMIVVVVARAAVLFLVGWELMTLGSYLLVVHDHGHGDVRRAGWTYLVAAHFGVVSLIAMFLLLGSRAGSLQFGAFATMPSATAGFAAVIVALAAFGFGVKAGFVPLHVWLPEAHAAAPSQVSAMMSAVMVKLGLYGLLRILGLFAPAGWWGPALAVLGFGGALLGISLAMYQRDVKRVLAYSTVENVGIITLGLGIAYWGQSRGNPAVAALGAAGALLHVWNHVVMKGLMFLAAGSVMHGAGGKDLERLGGVLARMPRTGAAMLVGAVAIAGLPPLNGFVGEWLLYLGLLRGGASGGLGGVVVLLGVGLLALVGGLAAVTFVRLVGIGLLGEPRSEGARHAHESPASMTVPLVALAAGALAMAIFPRQVLAALGGVVAQVFGPAVAGQLAAVSTSVGILGTVNAVLAIVLVTLVAATVLLVRRAPRDETWGCGYPAASARIQYTARSFTELMAERLLPRALGARLTREASAPGSLFPAAARFDAECVDPVTRDVYLPFFGRWADRFARLRWIQQGALNLYLLYVLVVVILGLLWVSWRAWMGS